MSRVFDETANRSERALQTRLLVPALDDRAARFELLSSLATGGADAISRVESDAADVWHFVWVLRDLFSADRSAAAQPLGWTGLRSRWRNVLGLPEWAEEHGWWRHPCGIYRSDPDFVVHPCHRLIGWTEAAIRTRAARMELDHDEDDAVTVLVRARQAMNTECDCFVQTPERLIVIECKDKTDFVANQTSRQHAMIKCLERALPLPRPPVYVEVSSLLPGARTALHCNGSNCDQ